MAKNTTPKDADEITPRKTSTPTSKILSFVLLGMLVVGLGGFGVSNFGKQVDTVITVGKAQVSTGQYARALKSQIDQFSKQFGAQFTFAQAQMFGLDAQTLQSLISNARQTPSPWFPASHRESPPKHRSASWHDRHARRLHKPPS